MKYDLDPELATAAWIKPPRSVHIYSFANLMLRAFPCRSDGSVHVSRREIPAYQGGRFSALVIEPRYRDSEALPGMVFYHGGGFLLRAAYVHNAVAKWYAQHAGMRVILPDYRLAPKNPFPVPAEDCYSAFKWTADHADELAIDPKRIIAAGDSAGGNLAAAVTLMLWDRVRIRPKGLMMVYPVLDRRMGTASMKQYTDTPLWDARLTAFMWDSYLGNEEPEHIEYASPMEAQALQHFPDTYIEVAEFDSLRDEGIAFAERLRKDRVPVELFEVSGACHGFETALRSRMVADALRRRLQWIERVIAER